VESGRAGEAVARGDAVLVLTAVADVPIP
jgi:hypothetical protein